VAAKKSAAERIADSPFAWTPIASYVLVSTFPARARNEHGVGIDLS
jgi:hypothetical protein